MKLTFLVPPAFPQATFYSLCHDILLDAASWFTLVPTPALMDAALIRCVLSSNNPSLKSPKLLGAGQHEEGLLLGVGFLFGAIQVVWKQIVLMVAQRCERYTCKGGALGYINDVTNKIKTTPQTARVIQPQRKDSWSKPKAGS